MIKQSLSILLLICVIYSRIVVNATVREAPGQIKPEWQFTNQGAEPAGQGAGGAAPGAPAGSPPPGEAAGQGTGEAAPGAPPDPPPPGEAAGQGTGEAAPGAPAGSPSAGEAAPAGQGAGEAAPGAPAAPLEGAAGQAIAAAGAGSELNAYGAGAAVGAGVVAGEAAKVAGDNSQCKKSMCTQQECLRTYYVENCTPVNTTQCSSATTRPCSSAVACGATQTIDIIYRDPSPQPYIVAAPIIPLHTPPPMPTKERDALLERLRQKNDRAREAGKRKGPQCEEDESKAKIPSKDIAVNTPQTCTTGGG